jgi:hypothetical protein
MNKRMSFIRNIYKKAAYEGFPFLHWFENDTTGEYDKEKGRLYIPFSSEGEYHDPKFEWTKLSYNHPFVYKMISESRPDLLEYKEGVTLVLDQGFIYKEKNGVKNVLAQFNYRFFNKYLRKLILSDELFESIPEDNFEDGKKQFVIDLLNHETILGGEYAQKIFELVDNKYVNLEDREDITEERLYSHLINILKDYINDMVEFFKTYLKPDLESLGEYYVVITHNEQDVKDMFSAERRWSSCQTDNYKNIYCEATEGGFAAYLVSGNDKNIEKPLSRIFIRRFDSEDGSKSIAIPEASIYGVINKKFFNIVKDWVRSKQNIPEGLPEKLTLKGMEWSDTYRKSVPGSIERIPLTESKDIMQAFESAEASGDPFSEKEGAKRIRVLENLVFNGVQNIQEQIEEKISIIDRILEGSSFDSIKETINQTNYLFNLIRNTLYKYNRYLGFIKNRDPELFNSYQKGHDLDFFKSLNESIKKYFEKYILLCNKSVSLFTESFYAYEENLKDEIFKYIEKEGEVFDIMDEEEKDNNIIYELLLPIHKDINSEEKYIKESLKEQRYIFALKNIISGISNVLDLAMKLEDTWSGLQLSKNIPSLKKIQIEQTEFKKLFDNLINLDNISKPYFKHLSEEQKGALGGSEDSSSVSLQALKRSFLFNSQPTLFIKNMKEMTYPKFDLEKEKGYKIRDGEIISIEPYSNSFDNKKINVESPYPENHNIGDVISIQEIKNFDLDRLDPKERKIYKNAIVHIIKELNSSIKNLNKYISEGRRELNYVEKVVKPYKRAVDKAKDSESRIKLNEDFLQNTHKHCIEKGETKDSATYNIYYAWKNNALDKTFDPINNLKRDLKEASKHIQEVSELLKICYETLPRLENKRYSSLLNILKKIGL